MPTYDYECSYCNLIFDATVPIVKRNEVRCPQCGRLAKRLVGVPAVHIFKPYVHPNLDIKPVRIESRKQEKEEFAKRGLINGNG